ncbi:MAG TPA: hypothetical protein VFX92_01020 [Candidatus Krumholzibacteria bacterium]|nr:hypothetical protein [Candidatus Krumholzibacteria bacterium]
MRKLFISGAVVALFAAGVFMGFSSTKAEAGLCYYKCSCNGVPLKCCVTPFGTSCKPDASAPIQCTQGANC